MHMTDPYHRPAELISRGGRLESALLKIIAENYFPHSCDANNDSCNYFDCIQKCIVEGVGEVLRGLKTFGRLFCQNHLCENRKCLQVNSVRNKQATCRNKAFKSTDRKCQTGIISMSQISIC